MPKAVSDEERIVKYFTEAPVDSANTLFRVVKGIMTARTPKTEIKRRVINKVKQKAEQVKAAAASGTEADNTANQGTTNQGS